MIKFRNVNKSFGRNIVLKDISFTVDKGNLVTIIGASGCGKTTTLKMINRLTKPTSGEIFINGENIRDKDVIQLRRGMGYVIQQTGLFSHMTVRENIEIIPKLSKASPEQIRKRTLELMDMVGMDPDQYLDRYPTELSGGQQQRIGVAGPSPPTRRSSSWTSPSALWTLSPGPSSRTSCSTSRTSCTRPSFLSPTIWTRP